MHDPALEERMNSILTRETGPRVRALLDDPDVVEVMVNPDGSVWTDSHSRGLRRVDIVEEPARVERLLRAVAALQNRDLGADAPTLEAQIDLYNVRLAAILPPVSPGGPLYCLRKHPRVVFTLSDLVQRGTLTSTQAQELSEAILRRANILVSGGTSSGKTTIVNALLLEKASLFGPSHRFVILEDTPEIQLDAPNCVSLQSTPTCTFRDLLRITLRLRPETIVHGEVRGAEALDLLKAWNTGHPGGFSTVHANSAREALSRIDQLIQEANVPSNPRFIRETINLVVHTALEGRTRRIHQVLRVEPMKDPNSQKGEIEL